MKSDPTKLKASVSECGETVLASVIVAAFRADRYLPIALRSALDQTYPHTEVVVADDADDPATKRLVESLADSRLVYRPNATRLGPAGNHREAIRAARGEYVAILNHDDRWEPTFLERLVTPLAANPDVVLSFCDHGVIDPDGSRLTAETDANTARWGRGRLTAGLQAAYPALVVNGSIPMAMGTVFRRSALHPDDLPDSAGPAYDLWLSYLIGKSGGKAWFTPERLSEWRTHPQSLTAARGADWIGGSVRVWEQVAVDPAYASHHRLVTRKLASVRAAEGMAHLRAGKPTAARVALGRSLSTNRWSAKTWAAMGISYLPGAVRRWAIS